MESGSLVVPGKMNASFSVNGLAMPKGSHTAVQSGDKIVLLNARTPSARRAYTDWTASVKQRAWIAGRRYTFDEPVNIAAIFFLPRPTSRKNSDWPDVKPDLDKLLRALLDPIEASGLLAQDSRVVSFDGSMKCYVCEAFPKPGAYVTISSAGKPPEFCLPTS